MDSPCLCVALTDVMVVPIGVSSGTMRQECPLTNLMFPPAELPSDKRRVAVEIETKYQYP